MITPITSSQQRPLAIWLFTCCFFILLMVAIGGLTRLTESGLSITEWKPIHGILPPLSEASWQEEFFKYQQSPEYLKKNLGMSLSEFKGIFWLEFIHRLVGRLTGFIFFIPLVYFIIKQQIQKQLGLRLFGIFTLGGLQGVIGWYMVKSGLRDTPHVSQYWLAFHLGMAVLIYGLVLWSGLSQVRSKKLEVFDGKVLTSHFLILASYFLIIAIFIQIILGAFVAGTHAGLAYNTFPDMNGQFIPDGLLAMTPWYLNLFENTTTIQFNHRIFAYVISLLIIIFWAYSCKFSLTKTSRCAIALLPVMVIVQICLGVFTLITHVPVMLASLHQIFALVVFTLVIFITHELKGEFSIHGSKSGNSFPDH